MHIPVMFEKCIEYLDIKGDGIYVDATLGGAGHSRGICERLSAGGTFIGIDADSDAIERARIALAGYDAKIVLVHDNFSNCANIFSELGVGAVDGVLMDLGCSSYHFDEPGRGFSYMSDGRLDMRLDQSQSLSAYDIVNNCSVDKLEEIIREYGEERWSARIAEFIVSERKNHPIETTAGLVEVIKKAVPKSARRDGPHPAKRTFQAIRIEVNSELSILGGAISDMAYHLRSGGRICIISFNSLEDRIVKHKIRELEASCICPPEMPICTCNKKAVLKTVVRKPILPDETELEMNHRSRSAKLRVAERL